MEVVGNWMILFKIEVVWNWMILFEIFMKERDGGCLKMNEFVWDRSLFDGGCLKLNDFV